MRDVLRVGIVALGCLLATADGSGEEDPSIFLPSSEFGPYVGEVALPRSDGGADEAFGELLALSGDTALVGGTGIVYVFDRTPGDVWVEGVPITAPGPVENFGRSLDFDGKTAIVGARDAAYLFRRRPNGTWREVAVLTSSDERPSFGGTVAIDAGYAIVGSVGDFMAGITGAAYIFQRSAAEGWNQVAKLTGPVGFGISVDISGPTAIVGTASGSLPTASIFDRDAGGPESWERVRSILTPPSIPPGVAVEGDNAMVVGGEVATFALVFNRNEGGLNAWGQVARVIEPGIAVALGPRISGDNAIFGVGGVGDDEVHLLGRNQSGPNAWGRVVRLLPVHMLGIPRVSIGGDTILVHQPPIPDPSNPVPGSVIVLVSDLDGDGLRDGLDPCVRDPFNNVRGGCRRASTAYPNLDHLITETPFSISAPQANLRILTATYTNSSDTPVRNPFFEVTEISGQDLLRNSDEGPAGLGATLSPDVGDGVLSPGETMQVEFVIRHRSRLVPLAFSVAFRGDANLPAVDSGWYLSNATNQPGSPGGDNYLAGAIFGPANEHRNFFVFDLSRVSGRRIVRARLRVFNRFFFTESPAQAETYTMFDVSTPLADLLAGSGGSAAFDDLGSGIAYGSRDFSDNDNNMVVEIELNAAAVAALNSTSGLFALGGAVTTLDGQFNEAVFGSTTGQDVRELVLTFGP